MAEREHHPGVSQRAQRMVDGSTVAPYIQEHIRRQEAGDDGYVCLAVAENMLMWDLISEKANAPRAVPQQAFTYEDMRGSVAFRRALAEFLTDRLIGVPVDPSAIVVMAGAGSVVEAMAWSLVDPGGGVLIPTPSYAGYWNDIESRSGLRAVPAHTSPDDDFRITSEALADASDRSEVPIGALLLTNPSNPLGRTLTDDEVLGSIEWARARGLPIIMNEVYGLSVYGDRPFRSAIDLLGGFADDVHHVWAFSKDFAASGLRAGVGISTNGVVREALMQQLYFSATSGDTQHLLTTMITDDEWVDRYVDALGIRLRTSDAGARAILTDHGIDAVDSDAGIFLLADFRRFLDAPTWDAEDRLWRRILDIADVNLTPGSACRIGEPGFMRICHASAPADVVEAGLERLLAALGGRG